MSRDRGMDCCDPEATVLSLSPNRGTVTSLTNPSSKEGRQGPPRVSVAIVALRGQKGFRVPYPKRVPPAK